MGQLGGREARVWRRRKAQLRVKRGRLAESRECGTGSRLPPSQPGALTSPPAKPAVHQETFPCFVVPPHPLKVPPFFAPPVHMAGLYTPLAAPASAAHPCPTTPPFYPSLSAPTWPRGTALAPHTLPYGTALFTLAWTHLASWYCTRNWQALSLAGFITYSSCRWVWVAPGRRYSRANSRVRGHHTCVCWGRWRGDEGSHGWLRSKYGWVRGGAMQRRCCPASQSVRFQRHWHRHGHTEPRPQRHPNLPLLQSKKRSLPSLPFCTSPSFPAHLGPSLPPPCSTTCPSPTTPAPHLSALHIGDVPPPGQVQPVGLIQLGACGGGGECGVGGEGRSGRVGWSLCSPQAVCQCGAQRGVVQAAERCGVWYAWLLR